MKLNILSTGVLCNDPLIEKAAEIFKRSELEKRFDVLWTIVTHSSDRSMACKSQSQSFANTNVVVDGESRKDRTSATRRALLEIKEGDWVWTMPEGFVPSEGLASKIADLIRGNSPAAIEGGKCSGLDHMIFRNPSHAVLQDNESMLGFFSETRRNGRPIPSEEMAETHGAKTDMERLSVIYWNLKYSFHHYTNVYEPLLNSRRFSTRSFLEIGVAQGASLRTFRDFFPNAKVFGLDIYPESVLKEPRINVVIGNSSDKEPFLEVNNLNGGQKLDVVIDDGSHNPADQIRSFELLWPMLSEGGLYMIEDVPGEEGLKNELSKIVPKSSITTFDLRPQSGLVDSAIVLINK
jgi:hypothetical protein